jgi:hypothetical protein
MAHLKLNYKKNGKIKPLMGRSKALSVEEETLLCERLQAFSAKHGGLMTKQLIKKEAAFIAAHLPGTNRFLREAFGQED